ncbi:MAG TPA: universal stress protein [Myxococcaceae bacterium]|jgi:nucleotide-binding universal stress UspA family protein|nr:universal stress protein [Myxococcaceae bacterium]
MLNRILVAVDGSEGSRKAVRFAMELARLTQGRLVLLSVLERPTVVPFGPLDAFAFSRPESDEQLAAVRSMLDEIGREMPPDRVEKRIEFGTAAEVIVEQAHAAGADLVVLGSRGHGPVGRWLVGSTTDRVVHHSRVPVTVVP